MSIITRTNPLNLQYRVCIVTGAFTPLGVIICKTLLKANALVLGVDTRPCDESLNARPGTHFQCEICDDLHDSGLAERVLGKAREEYEVERVDAVVHVLEEGREGDGEGLEGLSGRLVEVMKKGGKGAVVTVVGNVDGVEEGKAKPAIELAKKLAEGHGKEGIRSNVILPGSDGDADSTKAYEEAKTHMKELMNTEKAAQRAAANPEPRFYDIGNVTLFLAGDMGERVSGQVVGLDGSYRSL